MPLAATWMDLEIIILSKEARQRKTSIIWYYLYQNLKTTTTKKHKWTYLQNRPWFDPWVWKIPWRKKWQTILVFLPGEFHRERSLVGYSASGHKESDMTERLTLSQNRNRLIGIETKLMITKGENERRINWSLRLIDTPFYIYNR